jgi:hypothetical protein
MQDLMRETFFGQLVHLASRGKFFPSAEQRDPSRLEKYLIIKSVSDSELSFCSAETTITATEDVPPNEEVERAYPESGKDFELIDWIENDPEACP